MKNPIPVEALDKHIAFLGSTGSGKTSACKSALIEPALKAGERVVIIDPTGAYWGLRLQSDGEARGYPIYIFGGDHGDYPLEAHNAEILAEAFAQSSDSAVFDVSTMAVSARTQFFTKFAEVILRKNRGPLRFIIDESHLFMPQSGAQSHGGAPAMLHAGNNLVSLGRSRGFRIALLSQRPAKLHKDSLTQVQTMVAMRLIAPQDRKAIKEWVDDQADAERGREIIASLPGLQPGEGWVWAPMVGKLDRVKFALPKTFDSSKAPDMREGEGPELSPINLDALKGRLASIDAETKANDPKRLRAENHRLQQELQAKPKQLAIDPRAIEEAEKKGREQGRKEGVAAMREALKAELEKMRHSIRDVDPDFDLLPQSQIRIVDQAAPTKREMNRILNPMPIKPIPAPSNGTLQGGMRRMLIALAQKPGLSAKQIGVRAGLSSSSGTFGTYLGKLRSEGWAEGGREHIRPTEAGISVLGDYEPLPTGRALLDYWLGELGGGTARMLQVLAGAYPNALTKEELGSRAQISHTSGTFGTYLGKLRTLELIEGRSELKASEDLF